MKTRPASDAIVSAFDVDRAFEIGEAQLADDFACPFAQSSGPAAVTFMEPSASALLSRRDGKVN